MILPQEKAIAMALIRGNEEHPMLRGVAEFYPEEGGVRISLRVWGLPRDGFFALHIHEGGSCGGKDFSAAGGHWNPTHQRHPGHLGDLPPLLAWKGQARSAVWAGKLPAEQVAGKTVVIHSGQDDFYSQPSGNPGEMIGCGVIVTRRS